MYYERVHKTQSPLEVIFLKACTIVGLIVEPQYKIGKLHVDFAIPERKIAIEIDSRQYHTDLVAKSQDDLRNEIYWENGWSVIRILAPALFQDAEHLVWRIRRGEFDNSRLTYLVRAKFDF